MLFRTAEELLLIEYEILLVVLVVKFIAYLCIKHARWLLPWKWRVLMNEGLDKWEWGLANRPY